MENTQEWGLQTPTLEEFEDAVVILEQRLIENAETVDILNTALNDERDHSRLMAVEYQAALMEIATLRNLLLEAGIEAPVDLYTAVEGEKPVEPEYEVQFVPEAVQV